MKRLIRAGAAALMICVAGSSAAQVSATATPDTAKEAAINRMLDAMEYEKSIRQMMVQMKAVLPQQMAAGSRAAIQQSGLPEDKKQEAIAKLEKEMPEVAAQIFEQFLGKDFVEEATRTVIDIYGRHFTTEELNQLADFYLTPVGKKLTAKLPVIMQESMQATMGTMQKRMPAIAAEIEKRFKPRTN